MTAEQIDEMLISLDSEFYDYADEERKKRCRAIVRSYLQPELSERVKLLAMMGASIQGGNSDNFNAEDCVTTAEQILAEVERREGGK